MDLSERKKDIETKLKYLGTSKKAIKEIINANYSLLGRLKGHHIKLEKMVNYHYDSIKSTREELNKGKINLINFYYDFQEIFYN